MIMHCIGMRQVFPRYGRTFDKISFTSGYVPVLHLGMYRASRRLSDIVEHHLLLNFSRRRNIRYLILIRADVAYLAGDIYTMISLQCLILAVVKRIFSKDISKIGL